MVPGTYSTVNLMRKASTALTLMISRFPESAFAEGPVLEPEIRREIEGLVDAIALHCKQLERDRVEQREVHHPTKAEGREERKATGRRGQKRRGRKKFPTGEEMIRRRGPRETGGGPVEDEEVLGKLGGAVPLTEEEKERARVVAEKKKDGFF